MKQICLLLVVCSSMVCLQPATTFAFMQPQGERLTNFDKRIPTAEVSSEQRAAAAALQTRLPVRVDFDQVIGAPKMVAATDGFLTGPSGRARAVSPTTAAALTPGDPDLPTKAFLQEYRNLFGHGTEALTNARVNREFVTPHNGMRTVVWQQQVDGIPVFEAILISHTTSAGELVNLCSGFLPEPGPAAEQGAPARATIVASPPVAAAVAVAAAARDLGETISEQDVVVLEAAASGAEKAQRFEARQVSGPITASLIWLPMNRQAMRLCWEVVLTSRTRGEMFRLLVDVQSGEVLLRRCLTEYISNASYRVYTSDSPSPFSPGHPTPLTTQPPVVSRVLVVTNAFDTNASPNGWIDDGVNETRGNNVDAHTDRDSNNTADVPRPQGSPFRVFDFTQDLGQAPNGYTNAAVVQLFYLCNWYHDRLYELGFTEAAGNFQNNNFGRGGLGNDAVQADAQDGASLVPPNANNANFSTPSDGSPGRMQMYIFDGPTPDRDGDLDAEIVFHEHTHGLSNRRVGGGVGLSALQSRGMGEGWSDFYGLAMLSEAGDNVNGNYAAGGYATYLFSGLTQNYYYGIRRYPYSTDMTKNPLTFRDIDPGQASLHTGVPRSPVIGTTADEVHNQGEVWCVTLWDARANLVNKYGWAVGNELMLQLVTDAMNLSPVNPNFLQARDAILQADLVDTGGANRNELWAAFARRGMGATATSPASSSTSGLVEAYDVPDFLFIAPTAGLTANGPVGGPFGPNPSSFTLTNVSSANLNWSLMNTSAWITVIPTSGTLVAGGPAATVNVTIGPAANSFPLGTYTAGIRFTNQTSGIVQTRSFALSAVGRTMFDDFDPGIDLSQWAAFGGVVGSTVRATNYGGFVSSPNSLWFGDAGSRFATTIPIDTSGGGTLGFSIRLANGAAAPWEEADSLPAEGCVLESSTNGGASWDILGSYDTTLYQSWTPVTMPIPVVARGSAAQFRWRQKSHSGSGFDHWALEDVSIDAQPSATLTLTIPATATEGDAPLNGTVTASPTPASDLTVTLNSSDTSEVTVPATVTILAGQSDASFVLTVVDDAILDGGQAATITASEAQHRNGIGLITIQDNETATLIVDVPASVTEGIGSTSGVVSVSAAPASDIEVSLNSSDTSEIQVPATIVVPSGQTSAVFNVTVVDDTEIDGPQTAIVTAQVVNWTAGTGSVTVQDNETLDLSVTLPASASEAGGVLIGAGQVLLNGTLLTDLDVSLLSSDGTEALVPATVTIPAGQLAGSFDITMVDNSQVDGTRIVTITASAAGFNSGSNSMTVLDDESPPVPSNPNPPHLATNVVRNTALSWSNGGTADITNDVYFGTNPVPGPAELLGSTTNASWSLPPLLPYTTYYWQIVAHHVGTTAGPVWQFTTRLLSAGRVAVYGAPPSSSYNDDVRSKLLGTGLFTTVDVYPVNSGNPVPTLAELQQYDAVLVYSDTGFNDNVAMGNVLADYADSGGGLVLCTFAFWDSGGLSIQGRLLAGSYLPFTTGSQAQPGGLTLVPDDPSHPILDGVVSFNGGTASYHNNPISLTNGATLVAHWSNGQPLVGALETASSRVVGLNLYPPSSDAGSGFWLSITDGARLMANALTWTAPIIPIPNDLSVEMEASPDPVAVGANLTYTIVVTNSGPLPATEVMVTNVMSAGVTFVSATTPNGTYTATNNLVLFSLGALNGSSDATLTVVVTPTVAGIITNEATIARAEADGYFSNNTAQATSVVLTPSLTLNDAAVVEGNSGRTNMLFTVTVFPAPVLPVAVNYATSDGTAQAGIDYEATNGVINFAPGQTDAVIAVTVLGETNMEPNETFSLILSNANVPITRAVATGTILDDDKPVVAVFDDPLYVDTTSGGNGAESDNVQASLTNLGFAVITFTNIIEAATNNRCLLFPELETASLGGVLTVAQKAALSNAVVNGGTMIVHGGTAGRAAALLNAVFNWSLAETATSGLFTRTTRAAGTEFADDPASIPANNACTALQTNSLPSGARAIYEAGGQSAVALFKRGNGLVIFLGWDWFNAVPLGTTNGGWLTVLESAARQQPLTPAPFIAANGWALVQESCGPGNGVIDPDELVTVKFGLANVGDVSTTNLTATLLPTGGVTAPSGPVNYGALVPGGAIVSNTFSLIATGSCGGTLTATLQLQDGTNDLGTVAFSFRLGVSGATMVQNFDGVTAPTLPAGWTATLSGAGSPWAASGAQRDTLPNAAFAPDPSSTCDNWLTSPSFLYPTNGGQLAFRHVYSTESCCDACWLQISIAGGGFTDLLAAGGNFVTNGYPAGNGWRGTSVGYPSFITTIANLPAAALGRNIQLRWRFTSDGSVSGLGWYVDSISVGGAYTCCLSPPMPAILIPPVDLTTIAGSNASFSVAANGLPPLYYQWQKDNVNLAGQTTRTLSLIGVTTNDAADYSVVVSNSVGAVTSSKAHLTVLLPDGGTSINNTTPISIPSVGAASVYPSTIVVSNLAGAISKVTVTLSNLSHTYPGDLDILLVGPSGANVMLMSDAGGGFDLPAATLSFDDEAANALPDSGQIFPGAYRPTDYITGDALPVPAPAAPFGAALAVFNGTDPNGPWKLFVYDDAGGDTGNVNNGWGLRIILTTPNTVVFLPPVLSGGQILLRFATLTGQSYTVQYKNSLNETSWQTLQTVVGDGTVWTVPDPINGSEARFYRLQLP